MKIKIEFRGFSFECESEEPPASMSAISYLEGYIRTSMESFTKSFNETRMKAALSVEEEKS